VKHRASSAFVRLAPAFAGLALLAAALALRLWFDAGESYTRFLGNDFGAACWVRERFHLPCPNCGVTRAVILAAHGEFARAARLSWGGVALLLATLFSGVVLIVYGIARLRAPARWQPRIERWAMRSIFYCAHATLAVWLAGWMLAFARAWPHRGN
jgi:hypothetical protein